MTDGVEVKRVGHILEVKLARGKVNAIDVPTSQGLAAAASCAQSGVRARESATRGVRERALTSEEIDLDVDPLHFLVP